ncbi:hypothetical protein MtrunA17_Chr3g0078151 [Medicago truncatula]|uniref:Transmembrane protein n=1 Tax=Medicago truncatula TaxID=3880 RepID=A0A396IN45_MEDTR|nr:hypothetical protein MtrunA17_Chr3g0078151 [Medicago truncatula]
MWCHQYCRALMKMSIAGFHKYSKESCSLLGSLSLCFLLTVLMLALVLYFLFSHSFDTTQFYPKLKSSCCIILFTHINHGLNFLFAK